MKIEKKSSALFSFEMHGDVILASWDDELSSESALFLESIKELFTFAVSKQLKRICIDSGVPAGGTLTVEVMHYIQERIATIGIEKIALLESVDFHWDNNLFLFLQYLKTFLQLHFEVRLFQNKQSALYWLTEK